MTIDITPSDVAPLPDEDFRATAHRSAGHEVMWAEGDCGACGHWRVPIPADNTDPFVTIEHPSPCSRVEQWTNPNAVIVPDLDPTTDDVVWDADLGKHVPRLHVSVGESGRGKDSAVSEG
jgi:hypothetical protein